MGSDGSLWLEFPSGATGHADLVEVADRLRRDFGAEVVERFPEVAAEDGKEYWWLSVGGERLMLMRKPPHLPVGLCVESGDRDLLIRIGRAWGVVRWSGWRGYLWRAWRRLLGREIV